MNGAPSSAEARTGARLMSLYQEAAAHILAEEQAAGAVSVPTGGDLVAARAAALTETHDGRARLAAYVDRLERTHGDDPAMRPFIDRFRAALTAVEAPTPTTHLEVA